MTNKERQGQLKMFDGCEFIERWEDEKDKQVAKGTLERVYEKGYNDGKEEMITLVLKAINEIPDGISIDILKRLIKGVLKVELEKCR